MDSIEFCVICEEDIGEGQDKIKISQKKAEDIYEVIRRHKSDVSCNFWNK